MTDSIKKGDTSRGGIVNNTNNAKRFFFGIRKKLISIAFLISLVLFLMSWILLSENKKTIIKAVKTTGGSTATQSSNFLKSKLFVSDFIDIDQYIEKLVKANEKSKFQFESFELIKTKKTYIDADSDKELSDRKSRKRKSKKRKRKKRKSGKKKSVKAGRETVRSVKYEYWLIRKNTEKVKEKMPEGLIDKYKKIKDVGQESTKEYTSFIAPIRTRGKLIGFSIVKYSNETILADYTKMRNTAVIIAVIALIVCVAFISLVGNMITSPILSLKNKVNEISGVLTNMINGKLKPSPALLEYEIKIKTNDEINILSDEFKNMVTVIKSVIPYISASTLRTVHSDGVLSVKKELIFLFTDIRGFTTICEGMSPDDTINMLNDYLNLQTKIIYKYDGEVDKFVGDEMMAFFGGDKKHDNALAAGLEIQTVMKQENEKRAANGLPVISIGVGINGGDVVFGSMGAEDRMDFTSIGDPVNFAARLEGTNKEYKTKIIISEFVKENANDEYLFRELDFVRVVGKNEPKRIYELLCRKNEATKELLLMMSIFEKTLALYRQMNWVLAKKGFSKIYEHFNDMTSKVFLDRIELFEKDPPGQEWGGVWDMKAK